MYEVSAKTLRWAKDALVSGSTAAVLSATALSLLSKADEGSFAGGLNGPSQWIWGTREARTRRATLRHTALGYAIHHGTAVFWALIFERLCGRSNHDRLKRLSRGRIVTEAAGMTALAFAVDYGLTPRRLQPGFEHHLKKRSMLIVYAAFAAGFAATNLIRRREAIERRT
jgi:hypothetical protein